MTLRIGTPAERRRDWQRAWWIARTHEFHCPGCERMVPRGELRVHGDRVFCPHCDAVIIAPHGEPTGHVGVAPPPTSGAGVREEGGILAALGFLPAAIAGVLILYLFWMLPGFLKVAMVGYLGWRPIGWEATVVTAVALVATSLFALVAFSLAILATRRMPGMFGTVASIAGALMPVVLFHAFVAMPWSARRNHDRDWPPGARARIEEREYLGNILWSGSADSGGQGAAAARIQWDDVEFEDGREIALGRRPGEAVVWPIPDCPGSKRPEVPCYREPYTGPP